MARILEEAGSKLRKPPYLMRGHSWSKEAYSSDRRKMIIGDRNLIKKYGIKPGWQLFP